MTIIGVYQIMKQDLIGTRNVSHPLLRTWMMIIQIILISLVEQTVTRAKVTYLGSAEFTVL